MDMISFLIIMVLGILPLITAIIMRKRNGKGIEAIEKILFIIGGNNINKGVAFVFLCSFGNFFFLFYRLPPPLLVLIYDLPFICLGGLEFSSKGKKGFWQFLIAAIVYLVLIAFAFMGLNSGEGDFKSEAKRS